MGVYKCDDDYHPYFKVWADARGLKDGEPYFSLQYTLWINTLLYQYEQINGLSHRLPIPEHHRAGVVEFLKGRAQSEKERKFSD